MATKVVNMKYDDCDIVVCRPGFWGGHSRSNRHTRPKRKQRPDLGVFLAISKNVADNITVFVPDREALGIRRGRWKITQTTVEFWFHW